MMVSTRFISGRDASGSRRAAAAAAAARGADDEADGGRAATHEAEDSCGYTEFEPERREAAGRAGPTGAPRRRSSPPCSRAPPRSFTAQQRAMAAATDNADELVRTLPAS